MDRGAWPAAVHGVRRSWTQLKQITLSLSRASFPISPSEGSLSGGHTSLNPQGGQVCVLSHFSCVRLHNPVDCSLPGSFVHRIFQARILEWVAISSCRGSSRPKDIEPMSLKSPTLVSEFFTTSTTWEAPSGGQGAVICG